MSASNTLGGTVMIRMQVSSLCLDELEHLVRSREGTSGRRGNGDGPLLRRQGTALDGREGWLVGKGPRRV